MTFRPYWLDGAMSISAFLRCVTRSFIEGMKHIARRHQEAYAFLLGTKMKHFRGAEAAKRLC